MDVFLGFLHHDHALFGIWHTHPKWKREVFIHDQQIMAQCLTSVWGKNAQVQALFITLLMHYFAYHKTG